MTYMDDDPNFYDGDDLDPYPEDRAEDAYMAAQEAAYWALPWYSRAWIRITEWMWLRGRKRANRRWIADTIAECRRGEHVGICPEGADGQLNVCEYRSSPF